MNIVQVYALMPAPENVPFELYEYRNWLNEINNLDGLLKGVTHDTATNIKWRLRLIELRLLYLHRYEKDFKWGGILSMPPKWIFEGYKTLRHMY